MTIVTRRTLLIPYTEALESEFLMLNCCVKNRAQMNGPKTVASARKLFQRVIGDPEYHAMAVLDNYNREYMGHVYVETDIREQAELAYIFDKAYWGKGLATEALKAYFPHVCQQLNLTHVSATANIGHDASIAILRKLGFTMVGVDEDDFGQFYRFEWHQVTKAEVSGVVVGETYPL
ncbi:GNAT family N-acetyltransferase [Vibrio tritonius]|uniref:GNAT family N-acetyltransferase n=1 Tax=Vibrio tritonius TaxID=1435069 RepID=A0ABS7YJN5_9VIBR|nr:GNAT family protein [Vibrio tritonius]MCA2014495.1 GNAT family N-acetyltransferase [Vibrio tritonius]